MAAKRVNGTRQWREDRNLYKEGSRAQGLTLGNCSVKTKSYTTQLYKH